MPQGQAIMGLKNKLGRQTLPYLYGSGDREPNKSKVTTVPPIKVLMLSLLKMKCKKKKNNNTVTPCYNNF